MSEETRIILVNNITPHDYIKVSNNFHRLEKEIIRLNYIINELEKYLKEFTPMAEFGTKRTYIPNDIVLDKLQELKGSDKE